jgi:hypothetical protein
MDGRLIPRFDSNERSAARASFCGGERSPSVSRSISAWPGAGMV